MKLVSQPKKSKICGHCCVAMVTGRSLEHAMVVIGHTEGTYTKELSRAINRMGFVAPPKATRIYKSTALPDVAIMGLRPVKKKKGFYGHWVVWNKGNILCPSQGWFKSMEEYLALMSHLKPTSFLEVKPKENQ